MGCCIKCKGCPSFVFDANYAKKRIVWMDLNNVKIPKMFDKKKDFKPTRQLYETSNIWNIFLTFSRIAIQVACIESGNFSGDWYGKNVTKPKNFPKSLSVSKICVNCCRSGCSSIGSTSISDSGAMICIPFNWNKTIFKVCLYVTSFSPFY